MLTLDFQTDVAQALKKLYTLTPEQLAKTVATAMNRTMSTIVSKERARIAQVFDRPTPYAVRAPYAISAKPDNLIGFISTGDGRSPGKGTPANRFLGPEIYGGDRNLKRFERALASKGILPSGLYCVPSKEAASYGIIDQYGNIKRSFIVQVLSGLQAFSEVGYLANRSAKSKRKQRQQFFAVNGNSPRGLPLGIYQRINRSFRLVIAFVSEPHYRKRFDYFEIAQSTAERFFISDLKDAADKAIERGDAIFDSKDLASLISYTLE